MKFFSKILFLFSSLIIILIFSTHSAYASTAEQKAEIFKDPKGRIMSVINKGDWHEFPENSIPAILSAASKNADIIKIDIKKTSDGTLVLMADNTINRMCYPTPEAEINIGNISYDELLKYTLRNKQGDALAKNTDFQVPTLAQTLSSSNSVLFLLDFDWDMRDEVYNEVKNSGKLNSVIFLMRASSKKANEWQNSLEDDIMTMGYHKGNIVFLATSYVKSFLSSGDSVWLATNNPYGMNFQNVVTSKFKNNGRAAAAPSMPEICGKKSDTEIWWNDLINRGYSLIITDYPDEFANFLEKSLSAEQKLRELNDFVNNDFHLPEIKADIFTEYKRAFNKAKNEAEALIERGYMGEQHSLETFYMLQKSIDDIEKNITELKAGKTGLTITPARIIIAIIAIAAVAAVQIYTHKKSKKPKA